MRANRWLVVASFVIGSAAPSFARDTQKQTTAALDNDFGCDLRGEQLKPWQALTKVQYRRAVAVCNSWNDFTMKVQCILKKGTVVAIGTTQSASCTQKPAGCASFPTGWSPQFSSSPEHQVFINTYRRTPQEIGRFLVNCQASSY